MRRLTQLPRAREGVFRLGVCSGGGELAWAPLQGDPPHLLWAGTTGSGKTRGMVLMGLQALDWGWDVEVIDFKGGGDYWVLASGGANVWVTPEKSVESLKAAAKQIRDRNRAMWQTPMHRVSEHDGKMVEDRAVNFADLNPTMKAEQGWRPRLVLIDETASLVADKKGGGMEALREATQLGRSAGVHLVLGMQRPDADLLEGFIKHNIQARILSGPADQLAEQMVHGAAVGSLADSERASARPPGRGVASGFGPRPGAVLFQAFLLSPDRYLPYSSAPDDPAAAGGESDSTTEGGGPDSSLPQVTPDTPTGYRYPLRSFLIRPSARFVLRLSALRLLVRPLRSGPFVRDPALAVACKHSAGRCRACGSADRLEADHRRPLWAGGQDRKENLWCLCHRCHRAKTSAEATVRALAKRMRGRSGFGRPRIPVKHAWPIIGAACFLTGWATDQWVGWAALVGGLLAFGPFLLQLVLFTGKYGRGIGLMLNYRANRSTMEILQRRAVARERETRGTFMDLHARGAASLEYGLATLRRGLIGMSGAYLAGVFVPGLIF